MSRSLFTDMCQLLLIWCNSIETSTQVDRLTLSVLFLVSKTAVGSVVEREVEGSSQCLREYWLNQLAKVSGPVCIINHIILTFLHHLLWGKGSRQWC